MKELTEKEREEVAQEVKVQARLKHEHIIRFYFSFIENFFGGSNDFLT